MPSEKSTPSLEMFTWTIIGSNCRQHKNYKDFILNDQRHRSMPKNLSAELKFSKDNLPRESRKKEGNEPKGNAPKWSLGSSTFWEISVREGLTIKRTMKNLNTPSQSQALFLTSGVTDQHTSARRTVGLLINHSGPNSLLDNGWPNESHGRLSTSAIYLRPPMCQWTQRSESHDNLSRTEHKASATDNWTAATEITNGTQWLDNLGIKQREVCFAKSPPHI